MTIYHVFATCSEEWREDNLKGLEKYFAHREMAYIYARGDMMAQVGVLAYADAAEDYGEEIPIRSDKSEMWVEFMDALWVYVRIQIHVEAIAVED